MDDTTPEMAEKMREMIRAKSPIERLEMGSSMCDTSRYLVIRAILESQPNITRTALKQELFLKFYGNDVDPVQRDAILEHFAQLELSPENPTARPSLEEFYP